MAWLEEYPNELLINIYGLMDNIDDALHVARCSKRMNAVYEAHRVQILRKIIVSVKPLYTITVYRDFAHLWRVSLRPAFFLTMLSSANSKMSISVSLPNISDAILTTHLLTCIRRRLLLNSASMHNLSPTNRFGTLWLAGMVSVRFKTCIFTPR